MSRFKYFLSSYMKRVVLILPFTYWKITVTQDIAELDLLES